MPLIVIFDFIIPHQIIVLFIMVLLSNVGIFMTFCYFAENKEVRGDTGFLAKFRADKIVFTILYVACLILSVFPLTGAYCREGLAYRKCQKRF